MPASDRATVAASSASAGTCRTGTSPSIAPRGKIGDDIIGKIPEDLDILIAVPFSRQVQMGGSIRVHLMRFGGFRPSRIVSVPSSGCALGARLPGIERDANDGNIRLGYPANYW
jgi:hypothetical protein